MSGKRLIRNPSVRTNFFKTNQNLSKNTLTFENCSTMERYKEPNIKHYNNTILDLTYHRNTILEKYGTFLIDTAKTAYVTDETLLREYNLNPFYVSHRELGTSEYWWLVLYVNECVSVNEFKNFNNTLKIPNINLLLERIKYDLTFNPNFGILVDIEE